ncbi:hypothetical protein [uncultured Dokdonia sp.]|uniref:hypothetical protein n=1 Tax=uncultured Dokdonia sp. TaxID=575653 RepID=UPI00261FE6A7|nr:hypothetical protein [uncultured Dokdonia sp.]
MGLFDFLKPKNTSTEPIYTDGKTERKLKYLNKDGQRELLNKLGINPYSFKHEEMESSEISLNEEIAGAIKISDWQADNNETEFDYISLTDNNNGTKSLYLSQNNREERAIKVLVDKYFAELGETDLVGAEFSKYDLMQINESPSGQLREWNLKNFRIIIGYNYNSELLSNYVLVDEIN